MASAGFSIPSPFGIAAVIAAYTQGEEWLEQVNEYIDGNIDFVINFFERENAKSKMPQTRRYLHYVDGF